MADLEFGRKVYSSVEMIVVLSPSAPHDVRVSTGPIRIAIARGRIDNDPYTLVHNFGSVSVPSGKYIQILAGNGHVNYTVYETGKSDRVLPQNLLSTLERFIHSD